MRERKVRLLTAILAVSVICCSAAAANVLRDGERRTDDEGIRTDGGEGGSPVWNVLTKRNFSSQIRIHPHVLLMVTVPWSGESRSLMKEVVHFLKSDKQLSGNLKLMVVYKNTDKLLADLLDAKEGITVFYYHLSKSFKYQGRLNAQKILSSMSNAISPLHAGFPFVFLSTSEEVENFFQSTDKSVLLLDFCGWSVRLLHAKHNESRENAWSEESMLRNGDFLQGLLFYRKNKLKGVETEKLTCRINPIERRKFSSASGILDYRTNCTSDKFQQFESFFSELSKVARDFSLSPERQRFGVVSEQTLMKFLSIGDPDGWQLLIHFSGFSSSSKVLKDANDLKLALQMHQSSVSEVDGDQKKQEGVFPVGKPSVVLFIDRSSNSSCIKEESKSALVIYSQLAHYYQHFCADGSTKVKLNEKMSYKILNQAPKISLSKLAFGNHGNTLYNVIHQLLQQQKSTVKMKEIKISQLAKGVGFQLLSDDFNVELLDSQSSSVSENSQLKRPMEKHSVGSNVNNIKSMDTIKCEVLRIGSYLSIQELPQCRIVKGLALENIVDESMQDEVAFPVPQLNSHAFEGSFFFSDGGFRLLRTLTGEKPKIPSLVILDPVAQKHYIMPARTKFNFDSLVNFVDQFLNGSLVPHQQSEPSRELPREYPKPPLVNMDFREADGIPWVVANGFEEEIFGSSGNGFSGSDDCDKVVLFCNSWCGFCQRMELVVREVYRSLKGLMYLLRRSPPADGFPSIYRMDCTLNDCSSLLIKFAKGERYPALLLFPGKGTNAIAYQGPASVLDIFDFLAEHGTNSHVLKGILWSPAEESNATEQLLTPPHQEVNTAISAADYYQETTPAVAVGSVLMATEKLVGSQSFENSTILIVHTRGRYQGLILNQQISWDLFDGLGLDISPLRDFPLGRGGPIGLRDFPLVSLSRDPLSGYVEVAKGVFYGDPFATGAAVGGIRWHGHAATRLWFFYGYCSWSLNQLPEELADMAWSVSHVGANGLKWPREVTSLTKDLVHHDDS